MLVKLSQHISRIHLRGKELSENNLFVFKILRRLTESINKLKTENTWNQTALELVQAMDCLLATATGDHNSKSIQLPTLQLWETLTSTFLTVK